MLSPVCRAGADDGPRPAPAGDCPVPRGRIQPEEETDGLLRPGEEGRLPLHLGHKDAEAGPRRRHASRRLHGATRVEGPGRLLPHADQGRTAMNVATIVYVVAVAGSCSFALM